jgi:dUTPase
MSDFFILNKFGITPSKNYTAAGYDFYIPNIIETTDTLNMCFDAFMASYKIKSREEIENIYNLLSLYVTSNFSSIDKDMFDVNKSLNILHLYLAQNQQKTFTDASIERFVENKLVFDKNGVPGIKAEQGDYFLFNTGIKMKLQPDTAGIFFNKSGKGNQGFDIRACVVDEDYAGFVHMSCAYDKSYSANIYCGDKLMQMVILPVVKTEIKEITDDEFNKMHEDSKRGSDGFGSSDVKR